MLPWRGGPPGPGCRLWRPGSLVPRPRPGSLRRRPGRRPGRRRARRARVVSFDPAELIGTRRCGTCGTRLARVAGGATNGRPASARSAPRVGSTGVPVARLPIAGGRTGAAGDPCPRAPRGVVLALAGRWPAAAPRSRPGAAARADPRPHRLPRRGGRGDPGRPPGRASCSSPSTRRSWGAVAWPAPGVRAAYVAAARRPAARTHRGQRDPGRRDARGACPSRRSASWSSPTRSPSTTSGP